ncbi:hypothetical protein [uncultured Umboniibacter sp.]|uniref:oxidoreductase n=1 Tax=uncultured Umboniibacter sp. TaxID=1798917 RepID=UPI00261EB689|nr:hypothetical protein [uncultured Umboniibacter sp.]
MSVATSSLSSPIKFADASEAKNRFVKGSCQEGLANPLNDPTHQLDQLYRCWSEGGSGVIISGTVWINRSDNTPQGDLVLDDESDMVAYRRLAKAGQVNNSQSWLQLGYYCISPESSINDLGSESLMAIIQEFVQASRRAELAGFSGVQIAAHGGHFLGASLNEEVNQRSDMWGGDGGRRASLVIAILTEIRKAVQPNFLVSLTLDVAAFASDDEGESTQHFVSLLNQHLASIQLIGKMTLESLAEQFTETAMIGSVDACVFQEDTHLPFTTPFDLIAFDRHCVLMPDLPKQMLANPQFKWPSSWPSDTATSKASSQLSSWYQCQMYLLAMGKKIHPRAGEFILGLRVALLRWRSERAQRRLFGSR